MHKFWVKTMKAETQVQQDVCSMWASPMHNAMVCSLKHKEGMSEQVDALNQFMKSFNNPYFETYNSNWRNHPNFSWRQPQQQSQPNQVGPPGFNQFHHPNQPISYASLPNPYMISHPQQPSNLEAMLEKFITGTNTNLQELKATSSLTKYLSNFITSISDGLFSN